MALFFAPAAWVATEFLRGYLFGGFPWVPLGNSQVTVLPVAQFASVAGVYGLSALVAFVSAGDRLRDADDRSPAVQGASRPSSWCSGQSPAGEPGASLTAR